MATLCSSETFIIQKGPYAGHERGDSVTLKQLISEECANYYAKMGKTNDYCCAEWTPDHRCVYFTANGFPRCGYFERSVLPLEPGLESVYHAERESQAPLSAREKQKIRVSVMPICAMCGKPFKRSSNRQRYCPQCRKVARQKAVRESVARHRRDAV